MDTTPKGLKVWDLPTDLYVRQDLEDNFRLIDQLFDAFPKGVETLAAIPVTGNFAGRLVMLSAASSGFPAWALVRYDGSAWRSVGYEVLSAVPSSSNWAGRIVLLTAASGGFSAWDLIRYDGAAWSIVGGWGRIDNGAGATNIRGLSFAQDVYVSDSARGFIMIDRISGTKYRMYVSNGSLRMEAVT